MIQMLGIKIFRFRHSWVIHSFLQETEKLHIRINMASAHQRGRILGNYDMTKTPDNKIKSLTLKSKGLNVIWGGSSTNERYWKRVENGEALELVGVYWLEVSGKLPISHLSEKTRYKLYFNVKLLPGAEGWDNYPVFFNLRLPGQKSKQTSMKLSELPVGQWKRVPAAGLDINLDQLSVTSTSSAITFAMYEIECEDLKKGLVVKEVIIEMVQPSV